MAADGVIYMVLEYGDIDLAHMLAKQEAARRTAGDTEPDENFIRLYWQQMLQVGPVGFKVLSPKCKYLPADHGACALALRIVANIWAQFWRRTNFGSFRHVWYWAARVMHLVSWKFFLESDANAVLALL